MVLRDTNPRPTKILKLAEFVVAFGVLRDVMGEGFPERRVELDMYLTSRCCTGEACSMNITRVFLQMPPCTFSVSTNAWTGPC